MQTGLGLTALLPWRLAKNLRFCAFCFSYNVRPFFNTSTTTSPNLVDYRPPFCRHRRRPLLTCAEFMLSHRIQIHNLAHMVLPSLQVIYDLCCRYTQECPLEALFAFLVDTEQYCWNHFICSGPQCLLFFAYRKLFLEGNGRPELVRRTQSCTWFKNSSPVFSVVTTVIKLAIIINVLQTSAGSQCLGYTPQGTIFNHVH